MSHKKGIALSMLTNITTDFKLIFSEMDSKLNDLKHFVQQSSTHGVAAHEVEKGIFDKVLKIGAQALQYFFTVQGDGDLGETFTVNSEKTYTRLQPRSKQYQSIFGAFSLNRAVYGSYEGKQIEFVPLDSRLQLPSSEHSYLLQEWSQTIAVEVPFKKTMEMLNGIFPLSLSVDTLERTNQAMASHIDSYQAELKENIEDSLENLNDDEALAIKGSLLVLSADGKGIPIKHANNQPRIEDHQKNKGPKPDRKRMAVVGSSYIVAPFVRTPESVLDALFRIDSESPKETTEKRPTAIYKSVTANLSREIDGKTINATSSTFEWLMSQKDCFEDYIDMPPVFLMDGQISLWSEAKRQLAGESYIEVLDILHAISYMWDIAHIFYSDDDPARWGFMKVRVLRILQGEIKSVLSGVRQMATKQRISGNKLKKLEDACQYFEKNAHRMKYDQYLRDGLPIASGVIEGACRHFVKDRMERAGMQWSVSGAQAMLDIRAQKLNGNWDGFIAYRIKNELAKNHPHLNLVQQVGWPMAA
jgi:hypothetical protein